MSRHAGTSIPRALGLAALGFAAGTAILLVIIPAWNGRAAASQGATAAAPTGGMAQMDHSAMEHSAPAAQKSAVDAPAKHVPFDPSLPAVGKGSLHSYTITLKDRTFAIADGVQYTGWTFDGSAPGPVIHVRQGDTVKVTLKNGGAIPHSIDFHAARVAPNVAFRSVDPGKSITFSFKANDPGVFMYHCGTPPVLMHIANGMYGAIVVDPRHPLPRADLSYVLVSSEWYLAGDGKSKPAAIDYNKARHMEPDYVTFNGYANQYKDRPLTALPGQRVRFYVVDAGPSLDTDFHVVGTLFDRVYPSGHASEALHGVQTWSVPAGGGAIFDTHFTTKGIYPVVSHSFASVDMGELALVKVGNVPGTMSH